MDQRHPPSRTTPPPSAPPAGVPRRRWLGSTIAVFALVAIAAFAWYLTHRPQPAANAGGAPPATARGGPGGPLGAGGGRGAPPSTVGVATSRHADIPVIIEALGTVTSGASVTGWFWSPSRGPTSQIVTLIRPRQQYAIPGQARGAELRAVLTGV